MRYALIGCGRIAARHLRAALTSGLEVVALCDTDEDRARRLMLESGLGEREERAAVYGDYRDAIRRERPELVGIATDSGSHAEIALECLGSDIPLIVEKPLALSSRDAAEICHQSHKQGLPVAVCHQNRFNPAVTTLKAAIDEGRLGELYYGAAAVRWKRGADYYAQAQWRGRWHSDGGVLMNQCIHAADMLIHLLGRPIKVTGQISRKARPIEAEDFGASLIEFEGGRSGILEGTGLIEPQNLEETVFISGEWGTARLGGIAMNRLSFSPAMPEGDSTAHEAVADVYGTGHLALYRNMLEALEGGHSPAVTCEDGRLAVELVLAVYRSAKLGGVPVEFMQSDFSTAQMSGFFNAGKRI